MKKALLKTLFSGYIGQGKKVDEFERAFSKKFGIKRLISLNSGTSALRMALSLIGVGPGDAVISTPYTMVATNSVILEQFAKPVFADIKYENINIDPNDIEHRINKKTKAIICVHWGGYPCDMDEIQEISSKYEIPIIADAAHALGASYKNKPIGNIANYTAFSFQAIKHITTGDGGMLTMRNDNKFQEGLRKRWFGIDRVNRRKSLEEDPITDIKEVGYKYHMNDLAATIGLEQLKYFDRNFEWRSEIAKLYREELSNIRCVTLLENKKDRISANWMFAIQVKERSKFIKYMQSKKVGVTIHNWRNDRYTIFGGLRKDLPNLEKTNKTLINLPIHHALSKDDVDYIIKAIRQFN